MDVSNYQLSINNYQLPEGYKQTEVGVIPDDWEVLELGEIAKLERGKFSARPRNDPKFFGGEIPFIQTGDVTQANGKITSYSQTLNEEGLKVSKLFPKNTLFFTIAANIGDMGFASFATACPDSLIAILPKAHIEKIWIFHALRFRKAEFEDLATQNAQLNINLEKLNPYRVAVPPPLEQRAIAQTLSDVDALIAALDKLIAKQRRLKTATMQQLLTGKKRLPGFGEGKGYKQTEVGVIPEDWEVINLGDNADITKLAGFEYTNYFNAYRDAGEIIVVRGINITHNVLDLTDVKTIPRATSNKLPRSQLKKGDLVFAYVGTIGPVYLIEESDRYHLGPNTARITCKDDLIPEFLLVYFKSELLRKEIDEKISVGAQPSLSMTKIRSFKVIHPLIEEQRAIATVLSDMDAAISALETRRAKAQAIKQGMMQQLLTGKVRLLDEGINN